MTHDDTGEHVDEVHAEESHPAYQHDHAYGAEHANGAEHPAEGSQGPTAAQLRRFIKSRPYVPLHELRRRFELAGELDDVCSVQVPDGHVYVGLPRREAEFLATFVRDGEVGLELGKDPPMPIVVGVFPMRPVTRS
jgi:hypothetical protein